LLLVETIFDTLNAKAALYAMPKSPGSARRRAGDGLRHHHRQIRTIAVGATPEAFWNSVRHARPITIGFNCALGAEDLRAHIAISAASLTPGVRVSERRTAQRIRPV